MCAMDADGISQKSEKGPEFCFMMANRTVVEMPLRLENFTEETTRHAEEFIRRRSLEPDTPFFFMMSYAPDPRVDRA